MKAEQVLQQVWQLMGPVEPPCCQGCEFEWREALRLMREYFDADPRYTITPAGRALLAGGE